MSSCFQGMARKMTVQRDVVLGTPGNAVAFGDDPGVLIDSGVRPGSGGPTGPTGPGGPTGSGGPTGPTGAGGGGGGAAIQPETGSSPIKISAFPAASGTGMAPTDTVTGLQGGANVNWTQAKLLHGSDAAASSGNAGTDIKMYGGKGDGAGLGGGSYLYGGVGYHGNAYGASVLAAGGQTMKGGGVYLLAGGYKAGPTQGAIIKLYGAIGNSGGNLQVVGGPGTGVGNSGGSVSISAGIGANGALSGHIILPFLPTSNPSVPGALYVDPATHIVHWR